MQKLLRTTGRPRGKWIAGNLRGESPFVLRGSNHGKSQGISGSPRMIHTPSGPLKERNFLPIIRIQIRASDKSQSAASLILLLLIKIFF